jgi:hypothetical protein
VPVPQGIRNYEGQSIGKENLRQVQDRAPQGCGACDLRELETQAETGIDFQFEISNLKISNRNRIGKTAKPGCKPIVKSIKENTWHVFQALIFRATSM